MYFGTNYIPDAYRNSSAAGVSHYLLACRLALFPMILWRNPTWVPSTSLIISSGSYQKYYPNSRASCINALYNRSSTLLSAPSRLSRFPRLLHTARKFPMFWFASGQSLYLCSIVLARYWNCVTTYTKGSLYQSYRIKFTSLAL